MRQLLIATRNQGKIREIVKILSDIPYVIKTLVDLGLTREVQETGNSFAENAVLKAKFIGDKTKLLTLTEDSGLEIDALGGRPGIYSARYSEGTDLDRINKVLNELKGIPRVKRTARFITVVAIYNPKTQKIHTFEGESKGYITDMPVGKNGFGYDPIFYNLDLGKTNAQATLSEKNQVSHRSRAIMKCKSFLTEYDDRQNLSMRLE